MGAPALLVAAFLGVAAWGQGVPAPEDPEVAWAQVRQDSLPALAARASSAQQRRQDIAAFRSDRLALAAAVPHLAGRSLDDPGVLLGLRVQLDDRARQRADELHAPFPELGSPARLATLAAARAEALDAEAAADEAERRVIVELEAWLARNPQLSRAALAPRRAALERQAAQVAAEGTPAQREAQARGAAAADAELARWAQLVQGLQHKALVPVAPGPDPQHELALLEDSGRSEGAAARLWAMRAALSPAVQAQVDERLLAWWTEVQAPQAAARLSAAQAGLAVVATEPVDGGVDTLQAAILQAQQEATLRAQVLAGFEQDPQESPLAAAIRGVAGQHAAAADQELALAEARLAQASRQQAQSEAAAARSQHEAVESRERADQAQASARDGSERRAAQVLGAVATATERAARLWERANEAEAAAASQDEARAAAIAKLRVGILRLESEGPLSPDLPDPDALFDELRGQLSALRPSARDSRAQRQEQRAASSQAREGVLLERARVDEERLDLETIQPAALRAQHAQAITAWADSLDDELRAADTLAGSAGSTGAQLLRRLTEVQRLRQRLRPRVSAAGLSRDRAFLMRDLSWELQLLPARLEVRARDRLGSLRALPAKLSDWNLIKAFVLGSSWVVLVLLGWWLARKRTPVWADALLGRLARWRDGLRDEDLVGARAPMNRALLTFADLVVGWLLLGGVREGLPELGLAIYVYLHVAGLRFVVASWELGFAKVPAVRPALRTLTEPSWDAMRRTLRVVGLWWVSRSLVLFLLPEVLGLYTLADLARVFFALALLVLVATEFARWEPSLRARVAKRDQDSPLVRWLAQAPRPAILASLKGAACGLFLLVGWGATVLSQLAQEGSGLGRLVTHLGRMRLGREEPEAEVPALLPETVRSLLGGPLPQGAKVDRKAITDQVMAEFDDWAADPRRGLVVLLGDRGEGRSMVVQETLAALDTRGVPTVRGRITSRLADEASVVAWVGQVAGLPTLEQPTIEGLATALRGLPPTVFVIDDLHACFVRTVDGFHGLHALLGVLNATGDHHFWLAVVHRPAWHYLSNLGGMVNVGVFRATIDLPHMGEADLRRLTLGRLEAAGFQADFQGLVRPNLLGDDPQVELDRATSLFYRLLGEASGGNPTVALHNFVACLQPTDDPGKFTVWAAPCLRGEPAEGLSNDDLFVLAALRTQDTLTEAEVAAATDMSLATVRTTVRDLVGRAVVVHTDAGLSIDIAAIPAVTRSLRRRNLVQWTV